MAFVAGEIPELNYGVRFTAPKFESVDPLKEAMAERVSLRIGASTWPEVVASHGQDPDAQLKEIVAWNKKFDDAGLILDGDPRKTTDKGQVQGPQQAKDGAATTPTTRTAKPRATHSTEDSWKESKRRRRNLHSRPFEREIYAERFAATFEPDSWDEGGGMVTCCFYDGSSVPRCDYRTGEQYDLTLSLDPGAVRLDRLNNGAPVCDNHDTYGSITSQLGVVRKAWIQNGKAYAQLQISPRTDLAGLRADIKAGIIRNVSMGASIYARNETTPTGVSRRQMTAVDWEPFEISFTMVPAVAGAVTMSAEIPPAQDELAGAAAKAVPARATRPKESQTMAHQSRDGQ